MASSSPSLVILNDNLRAPPRAGEHIHLLSLARAVSRQLPTYIFCWVPEPTAAEFDAWRSQARPDAAGAPLVLPLDPGREPPTGLARTRRYVSHAGRWIDRHAPRDSVIWIRRHPTALFMLPRLLDRRQRRRFRFLYDASSFLRLECEAGGRDRATLVKAMLEERLWRRFDLVRVLSAPMKEYLVERVGLPAERVLVIPVGAEAPAEHWRPQPTARPVRRVLYIGSASAWQGLGELLAAMRLLAESAPEIRLSVVGVDRELFAAEVPGSNIEFHGQLPHRQAKSMYLDHDLFLLPRPRLPLTEMVVPMKIVEALATGIPLLATDLAAVRWVTGEAGALFVADNRPETLANGIRTALADQTRLAAVSAAALERVERFHWGQIGADIRAQLFPGAVA